MPLPLTQQYPWAWLSRVAQKYCFGNEVAEQKSLRSPDLVNI